MSAPDPAAVHLDTSFLIRAMVAGSGEASSLLGWIEEGRVVAMSSVAWGEFLCGPVDAAEEELALRIIRDIQPLEVQDAALAARLFNEGGRRRGSFQDCMVAATSLRAGASLATANPDDFERLAGAGVSVLAPPDWEGEGG